MSKLKIAIQKEGRLNQNSQQILKDCGISIDNGKDQLKALASNFPLEIFYLRNGDIPQYLKDGVVDIAIIGENILIEKGTNITILEKLGFSKCKVSLAIPKNKNYNGINYFSNKRIATSYPNTVEKYLKEKEITAKLHIINGSVEIAPNIGLADGICDIVSSGSTLFKNNLKEVEILLNSEAVLAVSPKIKIEEKSILKKLQFRIQAVLKARQSKYILLNAPNKKLQEIINILPGMKSPTVLPLANKGWSSVHSVINKHQFWEIIDRLKEKGAEGILVCPIEKMVLLKSIEPKTKNQQPKTEKMKIESLNTQNWSKLLKRPTKTVEDIKGTVSKIFKEVLEKGDISIKKYTSFFDGATISELLVSNEEIKNATKKVSDELKKAIQVAKKNITIFHEAQKTEKICVETTVGVQCWQEKKPIKKVGLYIPGGTAPLFSTVLMLAIPAKIAGCNEIIICSPPNKNGKINPAILYPANLCGVTKIYKVGGIQAIAGLVFGTETIPKVSKIFGPGNQFVTMAKQLATNYGTAIDMPAGPSELLVVADDFSNVDFVASDLLSQVEHGIDSQIILVSLSKVLLQNVIVEINRQLTKLQRKEIVEKALKNAKFIFAKNNETALNFINQYAPEHFIISVKNEDFFIDGIQNAGSVFIGKYTPESAGDYASGTNHTLPTNGFSKVYSGVNLDSFLKSITFQKISKKGLQNIGKTIEIMAEAEGLQAHKNAVSIRLKTLK